jgi:hypothetical protein
MKSNQPGSSQPETIQNGLKILNKGFSLPNKILKNKRPCMKKPAMLHNSKPGCPGFLGNPLKNP